MRLKMAMLAAWMLAIGTTAVAADERYKKTIDGMGVGPVTITAPSAGGWNFSATPEKCADGTEQLNIELDRDGEAAPPQFSVGFSVPQLDTHHRWTSGAAMAKLPPDWSCWSGSRLCQNMPIVSFMNDTDANRILVAVSEPKRTVEMYAGIHEENCHIRWNLRFFIEPEAPMSRYSLKIRFDRRDIFFGDAIREGTAWIEKTAGLNITHTPAAAYEPLYSTWYSFHQNVTDREIEAECELAAKLGMKVLIVDDGWQTDDNNRGYAFCGDWEVSKNRFPDMAAHVKKVHDMGMKYMVWYGVPMIGRKSKNYAKFESKYLYYNDRLEYSCLDPRFPEVRRFLVEMYEKAMREWNIDGFKLDFIDAFEFHGPDPAVKENYAGRDIKALPEAVDVLMKTVAARLKAIKPDVLIEFRQSYIGPAIRQYGNMLRAGDCPADLQSNRFRTANLRLTSGESAVHADMLEWNPNDTVEVAARQILAVMFTTIQYSVMLRTIPEEHRRMISHWLDFSLRHRNALLKGSFKPHLYQANYPWMEGECERERIIGVYVAGTMADVGDGSKDTYLLNATGAGEVVFKSGFDGTVEIFDTFGKKTGDIQVRKGVNLVQMPVSGYLKSAKTR